MQNISCSSQDSTVVSLFPYQLFQLEDELNLTANPVAPWHLSWKMTSNVIKKNHQPYRREKDSLTKATHEMERGYTYIAPPGYEWSQLGIQHPPQSHRNNFPRPRRRHYWFGGPCLSDRSCHPYGPSCHPRWERECLSSTKGSWAPDPERCKATAKSLQLELGTLGHRWGSWVGAHWGRWVAESCMADLKFARKREEDMKISGTTCTWERGDVILFSDLSHSRRSWGVI